jgi:hypothetical protein
MNKAINFCLLFLAGCIFSWAHTVWCFWEADSHIVSKDVSHLYWTKVLLLCSQDPIMVPCTEPIKMFYFRHEVGRQWCTATYHDSWCLLELPKTQNCRYCCTKFVFILSNYAVKLQQTPPHQNDTYTICGLICPWNFVQGSVVFPKRILSLACQSVVHLPYCDVNVV